MTRSTAIVSRSTSLDVVDIEAIMLKHDIHACGHGYAQEARIFLELSSDDDRLEIGADRYKALVGLTNIYDAVVSAHMSTIFRSLTYDQKATAEQIAYAIWRKLDQ